MKFFKNKAVAWVITGLVILGCLGYGLVQRYTATPTPAPMTVQQQVPAANEIWVKDDANLLSASTESKLNEYNARWDNDYRSVVGVLTVDSVGSQSMEDYAYDYGERWGLGENDMLLLISEREADFYFVPSYTEIIPDGRVSDALYDDFIEELYAGDCDEAVLDLFDELDDVYGAYAPQVSGGLVSYDTAVQDNAPIISLLFVVIVLLLIFNAIDKSRYRTWYGRYGRMANPTTQFVPLMFWHGVGSSWYRRMSRRYATTSAYRPGTHTPGTGMPPPGTRPGGYRPGTSYTNYKTGGRSGSFGSSYSRPSGFSGTRSGSSFSSGSRGGSFGSSRGGFSGSRSGFSGGSRGGFGGRR